MKILRNAPIRLKLLAVTLVTCGTALALACTALFWFQSVNFRKSFVAELESLGAVVAQNSAAPLAFEDKKSAVEVLSALKVRPHITSAALYDAQGKIFARFGSEDDRAAGTKSAPADGVVFNRGYADLSLPIAVQDAAPGRLQLRARFADKYHELLSLYATVLAVVLAGSLVVILIAASVMQRIITGPIAALAEVARNVSEKEDYATRAPEASRDEVGLLTRTFNQMLDQIQSRDQRLRESQQRYAVAVLGSSDGIWDWDLVTDVVYFSPRWKSMLGFADEELTNSFETLRGLLHPDDAPRVQARVDAYLAGSEAAFEIEFRARHKGGEHRWILSRGAALRNDEGKPVRFAGSHTDITERKQTEEQISRMQRELLDSSRLAGMAEVATGVLHNVGNVLNSVSVSATVVGDRLRRSDVGDLHRAADMLRSQNGQLAQFLTTDPKGRLVPEFLAKVSKSLVTERDELVAEMTSVGQNIEHIKEIVAMQQTYAKVFGVLEPVAPAALVADALRMNIAAFDRHGVRVVQQFDEGVPSVLVDRHKVLQILTNLVRNAKYALDAQDPDDKRLEISVGRAAPGFIAITVRDNGIGIPAENLARIFGHGFTTKKDGHGFGLHSGALAAKQMNGRLNVQSDGPGRGATFTLELPVATPAADLQGRANLEAISEANN